MLLQATINGAIIDVVALLIIVLFALLGLKAGFIKSVISTCSVFLSILLAVVLANVTATNLANNFGWNNAIADWLSGVLTGIFGEGVMNAPLALATDETLSIAGVASWLANLVLSVKSGNSYPPDTTIGEALCPIFAQYLLIIISAIILYILFRIAFALLGKLLSKFLLKGFAGATNRILGAVFGLFRGVIIVQIIIMIIGVVPIGFFQELAISIEASAVTGFINRINVFGIIMGSMTNITPLIGI